MDQMEKGNASTVKGKPAALPQRKEQVGAVIIEGHFQGLGLLRSLGRRNVPTYLLDTGGIQCVKMRYHIDVE